MEPEPGTTRIYRCPVCQVDTPHAVRAKRAGRIALKCSNCDNGSLVDQGELQLYQHRWEDELRQILDNLGAHGEGRGGDEGE
ncbi:hypothetical protein [Limnochorda pilosa]|uniref:Uncharacterized protein n=1 Tax=Limnochorda pilosa TaxID=1555112 RepID=A0A0K2SKV9_LIMPI|nr:hypothetical protein [Limnochorda pilosa]BAS27489.1 hypothetical protein LIP_1643 [Limnochorda pilosa]